MWQTLYESPWHLPLCGWLGSAALLGWLRSAWPQLDRRLRLWLLWFGATSALDGWWTGAWSPVDAESPWSAPVALGFVVLGDWRYFALGELQVTGKARGWWFGLGWALVMPVAYAALHPAVHGPKQAQAWLLIYELALAVWVAGWWLLRGRHAQGPARRWLAAVTGLELAQYLLWALADLLILRGEDIGYGVRLLPSVLFHAGMLPLIAWTAPRPTAATDQASI